MRILFYLGYQKEEFNKTSIDKGLGLGGSEIAATHVAHQLAHFGHQVYVSGSVKAERYDTVTWLPTRDLHRNHSDQFDVIIAVNYIHAAVEFKDWHAKKIFWAHNTDYHKWYKGELLEHSEQYLEWFDRFVCLTEWHREEWCNRYDILPEEVQIIGNGIEPSSYIGKPKKKKNSFIWSSAPERGLEELLNHWPNIRYNIPDATLDIYTPSYALDQLNHMTDKLELLRSHGVSSHGNVSQQDLHKAMLKAEFWPYLTQYEETYCITALEMQYAGVLPVASTTAALAETVYSGIKLDYNETVFHLVIELLKKTSQELKAKSVKEAYQWAKIQTWQARALEWHNFLSNTI